MRYSRRIVLAMCVAVPSAIVLTMCSESQAPVMTTEPVTVEPRVNVTTGSDPVIVAAGDAVCGTGTSSGAPCKHVDVATLITSLNPSAVLLLGDLQYENATLSDFNTYYNPSWGAFKNISYPAAGNHEYNTAGAKGYYDYFNGVGVQSGAAGDRSKGYYSFNIGAWHLIALNSNCSAIGGCNAGSAQEQWLRADLAANTSACTLAYWHHPRFSSGSHGNNSAMQPLWQALYDHDAEVVLNGHDHDYERFAPQTPTGTLDNTKGIRAFVVGTGGKENGSFGTVRANSVVRNNNSFGVLQLTLRDNSYDWQFVSTAGGTLTDSGTATCRSSAPPPPPPPSTQDTIVIAASADAYVLSGSSRSNYGTKTTLLVDGSPTARTYLKFNVAGVGTKTVVSATLRLYAVDPSDTGGRLHRVTTTSWSETAITWSNKPSYTAATIGTFGSIVAGAWYDLDVTSQVATDGTVSFALESTSSNGADYRSREGGAATAPQLVVVVR